MTHKNYGQIGLGNPVEIGKGGAKLKDNSGVLESRNNADGAYAIMRGDHPVADNDLVTLKHYRTGASVDVTGQIDGGSPPSPGDGVVYVCTTAGGAYVLKTLYYRTGAAWEAVAHVEGRVMRVTDALAGGTDEYLADHLYQWDADGATWVAIGPSTADAKVVKAERVALVYTDTGDNNLGSAVPDNAIITKVIANVTQTFDGSSPVLKVGDGVDDDRHMLTTESDLETVGIYIIDTHYLYGSGTQVVANIAASGASQGAVSLLMEYALV